MKTAYIAIAPCGCTHGVDCGVGPETHRQIAEWMERGSDIREVPLDEAKRRIARDCPHEPKWGRS